MKLTPQSRFGFGFSLKPQSRFDFGFSLKPKSRFESDPVRQCPTKATSGALTNRVKSIRLVSTALRPKSNRLVKTRRRPKSNPLLANDVVVFFCRDVTRRVGGPLREIEPTKLSPALCFLFLFFFVLGLNR